MPVKRPHDPTDGIAEWLHSASIRLLRLLRREDDSCGLTAPRLSALSVLVFAGPRSLGELAAAEQVRPPTMSRIVDALAAASLVSREPDPQDRRGVRITATEAGCALLLAGRAQRVAALEARLDPLTSEEREILRQGVEILERVLR